MSEETRDRDRDEKNGGEWGEKWSDDPMGRIVGGLILVWLGVCFLLITNGPWHWDDLWRYFLGGMGVIFLLEVGVRAVIPEYRRPMLGKIVMSVIFMAIGFGGLVGIENWWPLILVVVGIAIIVGVLTRSGKPKP